MLHSTHDVGIFTINENYLHCIKVFIYVVKTADCE